MDHKMVGGRGKPGESFLCSTLYTEILCMKFYKFTNEFIKIIRYLK